MKIKHILRAQDFAAILAKGAKTKGKAFCLYACGTEMESAAIGVIVPKAAARLAVQRNYIKRMIYTVFRETMRQKSANGPTVVVRLILNVGTKKSKDLSRELRKELESLFNKSGLTE